MSNKNRSDQIDVLNSVNGRRVRAMWFKRSWWLVALLLPMLFYNSGLLDMIEPFIPLKSEKCMASTYYPQGKYVYAKIRDDNKIRISISLVKVESEDPDDIPENMEIAYIERTMGLWNQSDDLVWNAERAGISAERNTPQFAGMVWVNPDFSNQKYSKFLLLKYFELVRVTYPNAVTFIENQTNLFENDPDLPKNPYKSVLDCQNGVITIQQDRIWVIEHTEGLLEFK